MLVLTFNTKSLHSRHPIVIQRVRRCSEPCSSRGDRSPFHQSSGFFFYFLPLRRLVPSTPLGDFQAEAQIIRHNYSES